MQVIVSAGLDEFWGEVFKTLKRTTTCRVIYWVGAEKSGELPQDAFYHEVVDARLLKSLDDVRYEQFDVSLISREDYVNYQKILNRFDYNGYFTFDERDHFFKKQVDYWLAVIKKHRPNLVFFSNAPHLGHDYPLYVASKLCNVQCFMMHPTPFSGWYYGGFHVGVMVDEPFKKHSQKVISCYDEIIQPFLTSQEESLWYMKEQRDYSLSLKNWISQSPLRYILEIFWYPLKRCSYSKKRKKYELHKSTQELYGKNKTGFFYRVKVLRKNKREKENLKKCMERCVSRINMDEDRFIYFPLHYQPEQTTAPLGGDFCDQIYLLREISKALPARCKLIVKEHPSQFSPMLFGNFGRYPGFWEEVTSLENVVLVSLDISSRELIRKSIAVITVAGTAGWEAIVSDKPCIFFGYPWYSRFPQAIPGSLSTLQGTLNEIAEGNNQSPEFEVGDVGKYLLDYAVNCEPFRAGDLSMSRSVGEMVRYLKHYCFSSD